MVIENGLDAIRDVLGEPLSPDAIAHALDHSSEILHDISIRLFESRYHLVVNGYNPVEKHLTSGSSIVTMARCRLPVWDDSFVDQLIKPVFFGHKVVVEDPIPYVAGLRIRHRHLDDALDEDKRAALMKKRIARFNRSRRDYFLAALHVSQQLAPLVDCGAIILVDALQELGYNPSSRNEPVSSLSLFENCPALPGEASSGEKGRIGSRRRPDDIYWDIALWAGCDFIGHPWAPSPEVFSEIIFRLKRALGTNRKNLESSTLRLSRLVSPPPGSVSPSTLARLWSSPVFEDWVGHLKGLASSAVQLAEQGETESDIKRVLRSGIKDLKRHSEVMAERSLRSQIIGTLRDSSFGAAGILLSSPLGASDMVSAIAATGLTGALSLLTRLLERTSQAKDEGRYAKLLGSSWSALLAG